MCIAPRVGRSNSMFDLPEQEKQTLKQKLPFLTKKRMNKVFKNILHRFLDNLADYIFINGKIYTMDEKNPQVQAVVVKDDSIIFAGKLSEAISHRGQHTVIVDLQDKVLLPGFIDPHIHMCFTMFRHWLDLSPFVNSHMDEVKEKLLKQIEQIKQKPNEWITGQLYDPTVMDGKLDVSIENLDKICPNNPLFILQANGHVAHVNSAAFKAAGITKDTQNPPHGRFVKSQNGQLTGELQQSAVMLFKKYLLGSASSYIKNFKQFLDHCASKGCTSLHDCGIGIVDPKADMSVLLEVIGEDSPVRYCGYLVSTSWETWMEEKMEPQFKDPMLRVNGIKCWADGSAQGGSAYMRQPYLKKQWGKGNPNYTLQKLIESIKVAHDRGWQVGVHANGDAGIDMVLDAFEAVQKENPKPDLRHRIQHCTVCHKQQLIRMKSLNVYPSFLIGHVYYYGHVFRDLALGAERGNLVDPMKTALQVGLRPTMHSDYNCQPVDPIRCLYNSVSRKMKSNGQVLNKTECLTPYQALRSLTIDSAWQCHLEDIVGSIQNGKKADFVILDRNPLLIPQSQLINIQVLQTWMDGQRRFKSQNATKLSSDHVFSSKLTLESKSSMESVKSSLKSAQSFKQLNQIQQKQSKLEGDGEEEKSEQKQKQLQQQRQGKQGGQQNEGSQQVGKQDAEQSVEQKVQNTSPINKQQSLQQQNEDSKKDKQQ